MVGWFLWHSLFSYGNIKVTWKGHIFFPQTCPWIPSTARKAGENYGSTEATSSPGSFNHLPLSLSDQHLLLFFWASSWSPAVFSRVFILKFHSFYIRCDDLALLLFLWKYDPWERRQRLTSHLRSPSKVSSRIKSSLFWGRVCHSLSTQKEGSHVSGCAVSLFLPPIDDLEPKQKHRNLF